MIRLRSMGERTSRGALMRRIEDLENDVQDLRRHSLRLAELADIVEELVIPLASRDEARAAEVIEKYSQGL